VICVDIRHMVMLRYVWNRKTLLCQRSWHLC